MLALPKVGRGEKEGKGGWPTADCLNRVHFYKHTAQKANRKPVSLCSRHRYRNSSWTGLVV